MASRGSTGPRYQYHRETGTSDEALTFVRRPVKITGDGRMAFTVPPEVSRLLHRDQHYQVTVRPVGTLVVR